MAQLALVECRALRGMDEFDRVFEGDDVDGLFLVDLVEQRGQGRLLSAAGRAGHQDEPRFFLGDLFENRGQLQDLRRRDVTLKLPQHDREMDLLPEYVNSKSRILAESIIAVTSSAVMIIEYQ